MFIFQLVMRFAVLGSGSAGNAAVVECGGLRLMIDAGLSARQLTSRMCQLEIDPASLDGIFLTHEHGDHVRGLKNFVKRYPTPVFATHATSRVVRESGIEAGQWKIFESGQTFEVRGIAIESFAIQHDAVDPVGFVVGDGSRRLGYVSDAGFVTRSMTEKLKGLSGLFVEANYDEKLLAADLKRPWSIKQRISSQHGHLSNRQVAELLQNIAHPELSRVVVGHLSSDCNAPEIILALLRLLLDDNGHGHVGLHCSAQHSPSEWFEI